MCCAVIEIIGGRVKYCYSKPQFIFVPNDTVPGQDEAAMLDFKKLQIPVDDINRLFSCFLEIDTDGSGEISLDEFYAFFKLKRSVFSDMAFGLMDEDKSGEIDFREFILTLWNFCSYDFKVRKAAREANATPNDDVTGSSSFAACFARRAAGPAAVSNVIHKSFFATRFARRRRSCAGSRSSSSTSTSRGSSRRRR